MTKQTVRIEAVILKLKDDKKKTTKKQSFFISLSQMF